MAYCLFVSEEQLHVIQRAVELFARIHSGQLEVVADCFFDNPVHELLRRLLLGIKPEITGFSSEFANHSIYSDKVPLDARRAYDVYQAIRSFDNPEYSILPATSESPPRVEWQATDTRNQFLQQQHRAVALMPPPRLDFIDLAILNAIDSYLRNLNDPASGVKTFIQITLARIKEACPLLELSKSRLEQRLNELELRELIETRRRERRKIFVRVTLKGLRILHGGSSPNLDENARR